MSILGIKDSGPKIVTDSLVLWLDASRLRSYPGSGTTWTDLSIGQRNATLVNGPTYNSSNGGYIVFDGTDDYSTFSDSGLPSGTSSRTMFIYFKITSYANYPAIFSYGTPQTKTGASPGQQCILQITNTGALRYSAYGSPEFSDPTNTLSTGVWYSAAYSWDGTTHRLYLNGSQVNTNTYALFSTVLDGSGAVAAYREGNTAYASPFNGSVSTAMIYSRALSATEILQNHNSLKIRYYS